MGFLIAIILGLYLDRIFSSKLYRGQYSLKKTFLGFGVLGALMLLIISMIYVGHVASTDNSGKGGWTLMAVRAVAAPISVYAFVLFVAIWRAARTSNFFIKLLVRYISIFYLSTAVACGVLLANFSLIVAVIVFFLKRRWIRNKREKLLASEVQ